MGVVVLRDPFVVAVVCLHVVAVLFLDELTFHAEVSNNIIVSCIENILVDLVHPDVALLHLLLRHDAVSAGDVRGGGRSGRVRRVGRLGHRIRSAGAGRNGLAADHIRHGAAGLHEREIPVVIVIGDIVGIVGGEVIPELPPRAQINLVVKLVLAVFVPALNADHVFNIGEAAVDRGINDPIGMLQRQIREVAALRHHGTVLSDTGAVQRDRRLRHRIRSRVVLVPDRDGARIVHADIDDSAGVPPLSRHALVSARAAGHRPPAIPRAVPPVKQRITRRSGKGGVCAARRIGGRFPAERSRVDGDRAVFLAEQLLKRHFYRGRRILQHIGRLYLKRFARRDILKLFVNHRSKGGIIGENSSNLQLLAVLRERLINAPEIRGRFLAVVCKVQRQNNGIVPVGICHDARVLIEELIVFQLDLVGLCLFSLAAAAAETYCQHSDEKQAQKAGHGFTHVNLLYVSFTMTFPYLSVNFPVAILIRSTITPMPKTPAVSRNSMPVPILPT